MLSVAEFPPCLRAHVLFMPEGSVIARRRFKKEDAAQRENLHGQAHFFRTEHE